MSQVKKSQPSQTPRKKKADPGKLLIRILCVILVVAMLGSLVLSAIV